jgi:DNA-binding MarR family transcriptional regulator
VRRDLSRSLHALTARMDRAADRILRTEQDVSYRRFLLLYAVGELDGTTQRELAEWIGLTEPSVSRMTRALVAEGLLDPGSAPLRGNRRCVRLTAAGERLVARCGEMLEDRFLALVESAGVSYEDYGASTRRLLTTLTGAGDGADS